MLSAASQQLDVVSITDHDTIEGAREFQRMAVARNCDLHIVIGEERTLEDGSHLIGLFLQHAISSRSFVHAVEEIREQGGICMLPHPFRHCDGVLRDMRRPLEGVSCFEVFNPKCSFEENSRAVLLSAEGLLAVGGSDAHYSTDLGECINLIPYFDSPTASLKRFFRGEGSYTVVGIPQTAGERGRKYASFYYRLRPYVRVPQLLVPAARTLYRAYRDRLIGWKAKPLETKYVRQ